MISFVVDLLQWIVVLSTVVFFVGFHIGNLDDKVQSDSIIISDMES